MRSFKQHIEEIHAPGAQVVFPHPRTGKIISGKVVRHEKGSLHGGAPFYVIYHDEYESAKVPAHKVEKYQTFHETVENKWVPSTKTTHHYQGQINGKTFVVPHSSLDIYKKGGYAKPMRHAIVTSLNHVAHNNPNLSPEEINRVHSHVKDIHGGQEPAKLHESQFHYTLGGDHAGQYVTAKSEEEAHKKVVKRHGTAAKTLKPVPVKEEYDYPDPGPKTKKEEDPKAQNDQRYAALLASRKAATLAFAKKRGIIREVSRPITKRSLGHIENKTSIIPHEVGRTIAGQRGLTPKETEKFTQHVADRTVHLYNHNPTFKKKLHGAGDKGRDHLYMFANHWLDAKSHLKEDNYQVHGTAQTFDKDAQKWHTDEKHYTMSAGSGKRALNKILKKIKKDYPGHKEHEVRIVREDKSFTKKKLKDLKKYPYADKAGKFDYKKFEADRVKHPEKFIAGLEESAWESYRDRALLEEAKKHNPKYEAETERIRENSKKPENRKSHKFQKAEWTHPNGHPRCIRCGDGEPISGTCNPSSLKESVGTVPGGGFGYEESGSGSGYKVGDRVVTKLGVHKGQVHRVIHVHDSGHLNIQPVLIHGSSNRYHLGAAKASPDQVEREPLRTKEALRDRISVLNRKPVREAFQWKNKGFESKIKELEGIAQLAKKVGVPKKGTNNKTVQEAFEAAKDKKNGKKPDVKKDAKVTANDFDKPKELNTPPGDTGADQAEVQAKPPQFGGNGETEKKKDNAPMPEKKGNKLVVKGPGPDDKFQPEPIVTPVTTMPDTASVKSGSQGVR